MTREHEPEALSPEKLEKLMRDRFERPLPKRFYKAVSVEGIAPELAIALDGRKVKTPLKAPFILPNQALADAVAAEWDAQIEVINPALMPLTKLSNTAIDRVATDPERIIGEILEFAGSDLICYRAENPEALSQLQAQHWNPLMAWAETIGVKLIPTMGLLHQAQPQASLEAFAAHLRAQNAHRLCAIHNLTSLTGSAIIAASLAEQAISSDAAWSAAHVDEDWQISHWGEDAEAARMRAGRKRDFDGALRYLELVGS